MLYKINRLKQVFGGKTVLDIRDLAIEKGKAYALLGPNGAGKTTLLNVLGFIDVPHSGDMEFCGKQVSFSSNELHGLRRSVCILDQHPILFSTSVYKNVEFGLKVRRVSRAEREKIIDEKLDLVGLSHLRDARAHQLSGGETQRVALARVLALKPRVLLCDEPTSSVDVENQIAITSILKRINREQGISLIFTSHDFKQASVLAEDTILMDHGKVVTASHVNLFHARVTRECGKNLCQLSSGISFPVPSSWSPGTCRVSLDPEKLRIAGDGRRTHIKGRVISFSDDKGRIRVEVLNGAKITLFLSVESYQDSGLRIGSPISLNIPDDALGFLR